MYRTGRLAIIVLALLVIGVTGGTAASTTKAPTSQQIAQKVLATRAPQFMSGSVRAYLQAVANNNRALSSGIDIQAPGNDAAAPRPAPPGPAAPAAVGLPNVRVNNPAEDSHQTDQTTQSETSVAVSGANVVVGFNDSQNGLFNLTAGVDLQGYAYSTNGGASFTDGGVLPNSPGNVNLSDPWLASDSSGAFYYSTLLIEGSTGNVLAGVSRSTDGGKTFSPTAPIPAPSSCSAKGCQGGFYSADKDALTTGPGTGNLYDVWDDITFDPNTGNVMSGLPVAHSLDGGLTWSITYASKVVLNAPGSCSFKQYIGAQPLVANGIVYDVAELISANDPTCVGAPVTFSEAVFYSKDGGTTWKTGAKFPITSSTPQGFSVFQLGPGMLMRNLEFPTLANFNGKVYMAWNDGGDGSGHSHIRLAQLNNFGQFASVAFITSGFNDEIQPALSADTALHVAYYQIATPATGGSMLDVKVGNSTNGRTFVTQRVTSQSFPGVFTLPQFDPIVGPTYMGDYITNVSDGTHQYIAWGDNRDIVTNFLWPSGRNDPDVFLAKQ